jgi:hypothetical protein
MNGGAVARCHPEDFENEGVTFGAGKTWRMALIFRGYKTHYWIAFSAVTQACSLTCRAGL